MLVGNINYRSLWVFMVGTISLAQSSIFNTTKAVYITLDPERAGEKLAAIDGMLQYQTNVDIFAAIDGKKMDRSKIPLYTQRLIDNRERHDHFQISTLGMIGCYMSHVTVWKKMEPGDTYVIFEQDAVITETGTREMKELSNFFHETDMPFDIILVGINAYPPPKTLNTTIYPISRDLLMYSCHKDCTVYGTRAYIVTYEGAAKLLKYADPIITQIDCMISLVASYNQDFRMYWLNHDIVPSPPWSETFGSSTVQDNCIKCHIPGNNVEIIFLIALASASVCVVGTVFLYLCTLLPKKYQHLFPHKLLHCTAIRMV